eukprot:c23676_g1_i1 orf=1-849(-)
MEASQAQLSQPLLHYQQQQEQRDCEEKKSSCDPSRWISWNEVKLQLHIAGPMIYVNLLGIGLQLISVMIVGHLGELELSSASIAASFGNVTGLSLLMGLASALETLCGQAYGAKQYHLLGLFLQRAILILTLVSIPLACLWANVEKILLVMGQKPDISEKAGEYAIWLIPNLFAFAALQPLMKFLQAQSLVIAMVVCSSIAIAVHIPICWLIVFRTNLGNRGAALATSISNWINVVLLLLYLKYSPACEKALTRLSWEVFRGWKVFFKLAIPSAAMVCLEWWS